MRAFATETFLRWQPHGSRVAATGEPVGSRSSAGPAQRAWSRSRQPNGPLKLSCWNWSRGTGRTFDTGRGSSSAAAASRRTSPIVTAATRQRGFWAIDSKEAERARCGPCPHPLAYRHVPRGARWLRCLRRGYFLTEKGSGLVLKKGSVKRVGRQVFAPGFGDQHLIFQLD